MYRRVLNILTANLGTSKIIDGDALLAEEIISLHILRWNQQAQRTTSPAINESSTIHEHEVRVCIQSSES